MTSAEENLLIQRMTAQEPAALAAFYDHFGLDLYRVIFAIVPRPALAEAILQESLIHLWFSLSHYDAACDRLFPWAVHLCRARALRQRPLG